jgi:hypothetical protein
MNDRPTDSEWLPLALGGQIGKQGALFHVTRDSISSVNVIEIKHVTVAIAIARLTAVTGFVFKEDSLSSAKAEDDPRR